MAREIPDAVFHLDGGRFVPTELARGPWSEHHMHGGAPASLIARAAERFEPGSAPHIARLTIELLRPVPLVPLSVETTMLRPGKKVQLVGISIVADGTEVVRATALRLRERPVEVPVPTPEPTLAPGEVFEWPEDPGMPTMFGFAFEIRVMDAQGFIQREPGPAAEWFRLCLPLVAGEENSPLQRVAAAGDFGNGVSAPVPWKDGWSVINPDLTLTLHRAPVGEWIGLDAVTWHGDRGVGYADTALYDDRGRFGRGVQNVLIESPPGA